MYILVMDGQGGGLGAQLVKGLKARLKDIPVWAAGANSMATAAMLRAGADKAATGENAFCYLASQAPILMWPIGLLSANALMGEISPKMAAAVAAAPGRRILLPMSSCGVLVAGTAGLRMEELLKDAVELATKEVGQ